jgi:solute carrier family 25, member 39/40
MATTFHNSSGQSHDRIEGEDIIGLAAGRMAISGTSGDGSADDGLDITATQKMMSAFTGSLLTSLLGAWPSTSRCLL